MGIYLTTTAVFIQLVDTQNDTQTSAIVSDCIDDAEAEVLKYLSERYDLTQPYFTDPAMFPKQVITLVKWLTLGYTYDALSRGGKDAFVRSDRYLKRVTENIKAILEGNANLVGPDGEEVPALTGGNESFSTTKDYRDTFDEGSPLKWSVDPQKLRDIRNSKI